MEDAVVLRQAQLGSHALRRIVHTYVLRRCRYAEQGCQQYGQTGIELQLHITKVQKTLIISNKKAILAISKPNR